VAIIGTGATAIQCVPYVGATQTDLRLPAHPSASICGATSDRHGLGQDARARLAAARRENFNDIVSGRPFAEDLVNDGWTDIFRNLQSGVLAGAVKPESVDRGDGPPRRTGRLPQDEHHPRAGPTRRSRTRPPPRR